MKQTDSFYNKAIRKIVHHPLCPYSRFIRLVLHEKLINVTLIKEDFWLERDEFLALNPSGQLPLLIEFDERTIICDVLPVFEYIEETTAEPRMLPKDPTARGETRRLLSWFHQKFYSEISNALLTERVWKRMMKQGYPDSIAIRRAITLLPEHFNYIATLLKGRDWLSGSRLSAADLAAAAHISVVDFLGNIQWNNEKYPKSFDIVRDWYARIKSRPSFRSLTTDVIDGFTPPIYYANPDF